MTTSTRPSPGSAGAWAAGGVPVARPPRTDDDLIACTLITLWALATGRTPPYAVPPARLGEQELIDFWSDPVFEEVRRP
ncbi:hypothetical protein [Actinomadura roseirufa]|uniref:hypothetical protein n=1 Tax=Actinomadura roseirufa TaxID=2094049 RepID=UPI0010414BE7|nr:hypothetical protein [Actinomadura roseirufa]